MRASATIAGLLLTTTALAGQPVYDGCSQPPSVYRSVWHFDPVSGSDASGDGSTAHPWATVQSVFSAGAWGSPRLATVPYWHSDPISRTWVWTPNVSAPVRPGDAVMLASGVYSPLSVGVYGQGITNSDWVTILPEPGATPVTSSIVIAGVQKLRVSGLKVQSQALSPAWLVKVTSSATPTSDIVLDHLSVSTYDDPDHWLDAASMNAQAMSGVQVDETAANAVTCVSVTDSHIWNIRTGAAVDATQSLFSGNEIDHVAGDFVDIAGSQIAVTGNYLHGSASTGVTHTDFIQGQLAPHTGMVSSFHDVTISRNRLVRQTDPNLRPMLTGAQGIDAFDGDWARVTITDNVVITSSCWGVSWGSTSGLTVTDNTILFDGWTPAGQTPCAPALSPLTATHDQPAGSDHVVATDNIAPSVSAVFGAAAPPPDSVISRNTATKGPLSYWSGSAVVWATTPGVYAGNNLLAR